MIELEGVSKVYRGPGGEVRALDDVSFKASQGEFLAICGHSGSGKSTLLSLIGGLALPTSGRVAVAGRTVSAMTSTQRARFRAEQVGFVFQMFHLLPYLNVLDNILVAAPAELRGSARAEAESLLERFGLASRKWHRPPQLSAGERQRVAMARALLNRPQLLLADEPTGNLDAYSAEPVLACLSEFHHAGGTVLLVTHDERAAACAGRQLVLQEGRMETEAAAGLAH